MFLALILTNQVMAQTTNQGQLPQKTINGDLPNFARTEPMAGITKSQILSNGAVVIDNNGTVVLTNESGNEIQVSKPVILFSNETTDMWAGYAQWEVSFKAWMLANPNFESYLSADELSYLNAGDAMGVYKLNYKSALNTYTRNQLNQANNE